MVEQNTIIALKNYFKKLRRFVSKEADFNFIKYKLIKKAKVDDVLCCIISTLPDRYKKALSEKRERLASQIAFEYLNVYLKKKFFLSSEYYVVRTAYALKYIDAIIQTIEKDIQWVESHEF